MTEDELLGGVLDLASALGYLAFHPRPARTQSGWRTAAQGNGARGFPDVCLAGNGRVVFAELKSQRGKSSAEQMRWLGELWEAGIDAYVWTPVDWTSGHVERVLRRPSGGLAAA